MRTVGRIVQVATALAAMLTTGCTTVTTGTPRPATAVAPRPVTGNALEQVLPDQPGLSQRLGYRYSLDPLSERRRGIDRMLDGLSSERNASPHDCAGVVAPAQKSIYFGAHVTDFALDNWVAEYPNLAPVNLIKVGVVALSTATDADALFGKFTGQWQHCNGTTLTQPAHDGLPELENQINGVHVANSVLAATVEVTQDDMPRQTARALGVRVNCIVEVALLMTPTDRDTSAVDIAHAMMDKVSELS